MTVKPRRVDLHPDQFIAGIAGALDPAELGVFTMAVLIVYSKGRGFRDDAEALELIGEKFGRKADPRTIKAIYSRLLHREKIARDGAEIWPSGCRDELELAMNRIRSSRENGANGGRPSSKNNELPKPPGSEPDNPPAPSIPLSIPIPEDIPSKDGRTDPPDDELSLDGILFRKGRKLLGEGAGGQITRLKQHFDMDLVKALQAIEIASKTDKPSEYVARIINGKKTPEVYYPRIDA